MSETGSTGFFEDSSKNIDDAPAKLRKAIADSNTNRLRQLADRDKQSKKLTPSAFYIGQSEDGRTLIQPNGGAITPLRTIGNVQAAAGQAIRAAGGGADAGARTSPSTPRPRGKLGLVKVFALVDTGTNYEFWLGGHIDKPKKILTVSKGLYEISPFPGIYYRGDSTGPGKNDWVLGVKAESRTVISEGIKSVTIFTVTSDGVNEYSGFKARYLSYMGNGFWSSDVINPGKSTAGASETIAEGDFRYPQINTVIYETGLFTTIATAITFVSIPGGTGDGALSQRTTIGSSSVVPDSGLIQALFPSGTTGGGSYYSYEENRWTPIPSSSGRISHLEGCAEAAGVTFSQQAGRIFEISNANTNEEFANKTYGIAYWDGQLLQTTGEDRQTLASTGNSYREHTPVGFQSRIYTAQCVNTMPGTFATHPFKTAETLAADPVFTASGASNGARNRSTPIFVSPTETKPNTYSQAGSSLNTNGVVTEDSTTQSVDRIANLSFDKGSGWRYIQREFAPPDNNLSSEKEFLHTRSGDIELEYRNQPTGTYCYDDTDTIQVLQARHSGISFESSDLDLRDLLDGPQQIPIDRYIVSGDRLEKDATYARTEKIFSMRGVPTNAEFFDAQYFPRDAS